MLQSGGYDAHWQPVLTDWINAILQAPLTAQGFSLRQLTAKNKQVEMEFYLPVAGPLKADALDALIRQYDPLSAGCPPLNFRQVQGMLKGFIDWSSVTKDGTTCWITNQTGWARTAQPIPSRRWRPPCKCIATICNISSIPRRCTAICATVLRIIATTIILAVSSTCSCAGLTLPIRAPGSSALVRMRN